jgi:plastocyanin
MRGRGSRVGAVVAAAVAMGWALGTPSAATALPALHSEIVSVRQVEPGVQRYLFRYGPLIAAPGQNLVLVGPVTIEKPPGDGYVKRMRPDLVGTDGKAPPVDVVHTHHAILFNLSEPDPVTPVHEESFPTPLRIVGWAEEKTIATLPDPYGYPVKSSDVWGMEYMLHNSTPETRIVYMELELDWVPAGTPAAAATKPAYPLWFDVRNGEAYPVFDVPRGSGHNGTATYPDDFPDAYKNAPKGINGDPNSSARNDWIADRDMTLVASAGHFHPGGLHTDLNVVRDGRSALAFRSTAHYFDPNGPVSWDMAMELTRPDWRVKVRKGDTLRVSATYDTTRASWYESMGIMLVYYTPDDAGGLDPFTQKVPTSGEPTHGHLKESDNHGGAPTNLPDPSTLPDGATVQDGVGVADFVYAPGDTSLSGQLGLPPVVDPGKSLTFVNGDASAQIPHTITACRAPCNRSTGISYPLADGDVQFDSGQLGYGTPAFSAFAQRADYSTPADLEPGTYTYFCRIHPYMRGAFRVRGTPRPKPPSGGQGSSGGPSARVRTKRATADRGGRVRVKLACSGGSGKCTGKLLLRAAVSGRTRTLGAARYSVKAGRSATVRVQLTRSARSLLRRRGSLRASAVARGPQGAVTRSVVLRRAPRR